MTPREIYKTFKAFERLMKLKTDQIAMLAFYVLAPHSKEVTYEGIRESFGFIGPNNSEEEEE